MNRAIAAGVAIGIALTLAIHPPVSTHRAYVIKPCASEDSQNCYWDAAHRGNGRGVSFVNLNGTYYYASTGN